MSAVGTQYANSEDRKIGRKQFKSLKVCPTPSWGWGREENEGLGYRSTPSLMFMSNPSQTRRGAGGPKSVTNQTCSGGETERRRDGAGHKSKALYCGDRGSVHVTNQSSSVSGMAGETNHGDPISSAACPSVRREKIKSWAVVEPDIKKTEREIK